MSDQKLSHFLQPCANLPDTLASFQYFESTNTLSRSIRDTKKMLKNCNCFNIVTPDQFERVEDMRIHEILKALKKILQMEIIFIYGSGDASELAKNACSAHESHKIKWCSNCHGNSMRFLASLDAFPSETTADKSSCDRSKPQEIDLNGICIPVTRNESKCYGSIYCAPKNRRTPLGMLEEQVMATAAKLIAQKLAPFDQ